MCVIHSFILSLLPSFFPPATVTVPWYLASQSPCLHPVEEYECLVRSSQLATDTVAFEQPIVRSGSHLATQCVT